MPQLGETVTEGTVTKWLKAVGETVQRDEPLFEVSTDKVDSEVPSPAAGVLEQIVVAEGETVDVGTVLAIVSADGAAGAAATKVAPAPEVAPAVGSGPPPGPDRGGNRILSPVVRRLLDENGIDASEVVGSGLGGRITRADVLTVIDTRRAGGSPAGDRPTPSPQQAPAPNQAGSAVQGWAGTDEVIPFTNIRRRTAEHMVRSKATSPHTLVVVETDYENVERVRRSHGSAFKEEEGFSLTYLPFVARATVEALRDFPNLNASVGDDALIVHHRVGLGIAVDLDHHGLIVPVVPRAEELTLRGIARRIHELADRARRKKLSADDISGGTFSITNAGPFGTFLTAPIINQPQVAILSTDGVKRRPTVVVQDDGTEAIAIHSTGMLCLAWDHRAVDGAYAAAFVARVASTLGSHDWVAEL